MKRLSDTERRRYNGDTGLCAYFSWGTVRGRGGGGPITAATDVPGDHPRRDRAQVLMSTKR